MLGYVIHWVCPFYQLGGSDVKEQMKLKISDYQNFGGDGFWNSFSSKFEQGLNS